MIPFLSLCIYITHKGAVILEKRIVVSENGKAIYDIVLTKSYNNLPAELEKFHLQGHKLCIVTDSNVSKLYGDELEKLLENFAFSVKRFTFPAGEKSKNLDTVKKLYEYLILEKFDRNDMIIALGGGVTGDLAGYTAATYLRGIRFIQIPTTLLSMVDSSIGGKTGVDFNAYKNMVGAFHQPSCVYINLSVLNSLDEQQFRCGMGEIIKHGLIKDKIYYDWLKKNSSGILSRDTDLLEEMIYQSCMIKKEVVEKDPKEAGERALLNFGHTIGHSIEKLKNFSMLHGECVAIGSIAASYISFKRNYLSEIEMNDIKNTFIRFGFQDFVSGINITKTIEATRHDKKMEAGKIKFILLKNIGEAVIEHNVTDNEMEEAIAFITERL